MARSHKTRKERPVLSPEAARRNRAIGLAIALLLFVLLLYLGTFAKLWG